MFNLKDATGAVIATTESCFASTGTDSSVGTSTVSCGEGITEGEFSFSNIGTGTYWVSEVVPSGWVSTGSDTSQVTFNDVATSTSELSFGNVRPGTLVIHKTVLSSTGSDTTDTQQFTVTLNGINPQTISQGTNTIYNLLPGTYALAENATTGYNQVSMGSSTISLVSGGHGNC